MATTTTNLGLTKPGADDPVNIQVLNGNFDNIDAAIGAIGTVGSTNNIMYLLQRGSPNGKGAIVNSPADGFDTVFDAINNTYVGSSATADSKDIMDGIIALASDTSTVANNSVGIYHVTGASATSKYGVCIIDKRSSVQYMAGVYFPITGTVPFYFRRYGASYCIRFLI